MKGRTISGDFFHPKPEAGELVPTEGKGMLEETNQAKAASHMVTALHLAEGEKMRAGTHEVEQRKRKYPGIESS